MTIEITSVTIKNAEKIVEIEGNNLESIYMNENLSEDFEAVPVKFQFDLSNRGNWCYLYKFCKSQKKNKDAKNMEQMLNNCIGLITFMNAAFLQKEN